MDLSDPTRLVASMEVSMAGYDEGKPVDMDKAVEALIRLVRESGDKGVISDEVWEKLNKMGLDPGERTRLRGTIVNKAKVTALTTPSGKRYIFKANKEKRDGNRTETVTHELSNGKIVITDANIDATYRNVIRIQITRRTGK